MSNIVENNDKMTQETVTSIHRWTSTLYSFRITRPAGYTFVAGQFSRLGLLINGEMVTRAYSVTSAEEDDTLEYYVIDVPGGLFTTQLRSLVPGDTIWLEKTTYGFMTPDRFTPASDLWMLATGTGLGPFISILYRRDIWQNYRRLVLVHGVRQADELAYHDTLRALQEQAAALSLPATLTTIFSVTRESTLPDNAFAGRITTLLQDGTLELAAGVTLHPDTSRIMLCGNPEMITQTRELLRDKGFTPVRRDGSGQFISENYWS